MTRDISATDSNALKMSELQGDAYYRIELRAHNAIGFSQPSHLLMRTARGESTNALGSLLYRSGIKSAAMMHTTTARELLLFMLSSICVCRFFV